MSQIRSPSLARCYGMVRVARVWKVSRASVYRSLKETPPNTIGRPGPVGACSDAELAEQIRQHIAASRLHGEGYRKLWARLRFAGVRTSPRRVRRVMRENGLLAPHRVGRTETRPHDGTIITNRVNEMWGTDMTQTITIREGRANVFVAVEHANSEVVGIHASGSANRFEALEPVRQGVHRCFGAIAPGVAHGLKLRHDHGSNYMSGDFQAEIECLGIEASPSFVREPEGNGVAERFIRTLKENLLWVRTFDTIEELRTALVEFATRYNETWLVARHGYRTPAQVRADHCRLCVHCSRSLPSNSWWQTMAGWQVLSRPSAAEGGGRRPAFTGPATQPYSATEVDGWQQLSRVSQSRAAVHKTSTATRDRPSLYQPHRVRLPNRTAPSHSGQTN